MSEVEPQLAAAQLAASTATRPSKPRHGLHLDHDADIDLRRRVSNFLSRCHWPGLRELDVEASDGTVILRGRLPSFHSKQVAIHSCQRVAGVLRVVDDVCVE